MEALIARILGDLREQAERYFGAPVRHAVSGRPVRFVGAETEADDDYAVSRLRAAYRIAGYESVEFEMEPVAAAYYYESTLDHDELILIGDFGGGTSDFSLLQVGPGVRRRGRSPRDFLGNSGVGIAGDAFDARSSATWSRPSWARARRLALWIRSCPRCRTGCTPSWNAGITSRSCAPERF